MLTVNFKANAELIKAVEASEITGFKIRVKTKAGNTITDQDYRGVYATKYTTLVLADKKKKLLTQQIMIYMVLIAEQLRLLLIKYLIMSYLTSQLLGWI